MELAAEIDPASRARDQIGVFFFVMSLPLAAGAAIAARAPRGKILEHGVWWWTGFALAFLLPALCFAVVPWLKRRFYGRPQKGGAAAEAAIGFQVLMAATIALLALDAAAVGLSLLPVAYAVPPVLVAVALHFAARGRPVGLLVAIPFIAYWNALLIQFSKGALHLLSG